MEFLQEYQAHLIYFFVVIASMVVLRLLTKFFYRRLDLRTAEQIPMESRDSLLLVRRILNALWS